MTGPSGTNHGHIPPRPGQPQPLAPQAREVVTGSTAAGFLNVAGRLFAPLQGLDPNNILMGGYGWLSQTDGGATLHPGLDLNSGSSCNDDEGKTVVTPLAGIVRQVLYWDGYSAGEGNHVWVELDDPCLPGVTWFHVDHLQHVAVANGQRLAAGESVGLAGRTGGWDCAHAHVELLRGPPANGWWQWPKYWSRAQVEAAYWAPKPWWDAASALVLAEGGQPVPPEQVQAMTEWELINWVLATLYQWQSLGEQFNPDSGISKTWVAALRDGHYPGRPRTGERPFGDPQTGVWAEFEGGLLIYKADGTMSWRG